MTTSLTLLQGFSPKLRGREQNECRTLQINMPPPVNVDIEFKGVTMEATTGFIKKNKKTILKNISGDFKSGELTAIMGPSGAGKTSLLNALTGYSLKGVTGVIRAGNSVCEFDSTNSYQTLNAYRKKSCYILQDDKLNPLFLVSEQMQFAADLKLGDTFTQKLKNSVISDVLKTLGLTGTENTPCSKLSGGQRRRLSIAVELIDNPPVLFLDEPTTGLDSVSSKQCMELLQNLARVGRTIICTIHQPSATIYKMFDQVYVLAEGQCVYQGPSSHTVPHLASLGLVCPKYHNPADYILELANGEHGQLNELLTANCVPEKLNERIPELPIENRPALSNEKMTIVINRPYEFYKFKVLFKRCVVQQCRDWTVVPLRMVIHVIIGIMLGLFFNNVGNDASRTLSNLGFLIISPTYLCYTSLIPAVLRFPDELPVLKKEHFNNWYNLKTYYIAVLVTNTPIQICYSLIYSIPAYLLSGQPIELHRFAMFVLILSNVSLIADTIGIFIGSCVNPINGTFLGAITTCVMIVFAGFLVIPSHMPSILQPVAHGSFLKQVYEALTLSMYSFDRTPLACGEDKIYCHLKLKFLLIVLLLKCVNLSDVSYYEILGVSKQATTQEIRQAYKKLAVKLHPDKNSDSKEQKKFLEITEAYEILKDPNKRRHYDIYGSQQSYTRKYDYHSQTEYNNLYYNGLYHDNPHVKTLSGREFYQYLNEGLYFINFYSPFCPPCQNLANHWKKLAQTYKGIVKVAAVNCKYHNSFCYNNMRISSYPSLYFYPYGKHGSFIYYNGAHTFEALEKFVLKYINNKINVVKVNQARSTNQPTLYVLDEDAITDEVITRIAFQLNGIATVVKAGDAIRRKLTDNDEAIFVFKYKQTHRDITSLGEANIINSVLNSLPTIQRIGLNNLKTIRNNLRNGNDKPWILFFFKKGDDKLLLHQLRVELADMNFGEIDCDENTELCASFQIDETPDWSILKVGGAYQRLVTPTSADINKAARAQSLHTLSAADMKRIFDGDVSTWVLLVAPFRVPWEHLVEPFTQVSLELGHNANFGIMSCTVDTDGQCRRLTEGQASVVIVNGTLTDIYHGDINKEELVDFIQIVQDTSDVLISEEQVMDLVHRRSVGWLVAFMPKCGSTCHRLLHQMRIVAKRLKPLESVRVGVLLCENQSGFCGNVRSPTLRYYPPKHSHLYTVSLQHLSEAPYILEWALEYIDKSVTPITWRTFTKDVIAEELNPTSVKKPWLVYFHSPRCYRCYEMYPDFAILSIFLKNNIQFGKVNCVSERGLCQHEHITSYPSIKLYLSRNKKNPSRIIPLQAKNYLSLLQDIQPHVTKYDNDLLQSIQNIGIKSHIRDEL
nr:dnaJ homolog subfamily C member 10-like [Danaus plexippus plexippus]